jgi:hypothetical protein
MAPKRSRSAPGLGNLPPEDAIDYPTADEIAERAHELFISGGRRIARIPDYWRMAEAELLTQAAQRIPGRARRPGDR